MIWAPVRVERVTATVTEDCSVSNTFDNWIKYGEEIHDNHENELKINFIFKIMLHVGRLLNFVLLIFLSRIAKSDRFHLLVTLLGKPLDKTDPWKLTIFLLLLNDLVLPYISVISTFFQKKIDNRKSKLDYLRLWHDMKNNMLFCFNLE